MRFVDRYMDTGLFLEVPVKVGGEVNRFLVLLAEPLPVRTLDHLSVGAMQFRFFLIVIPQRRNVRIVFPYRLEI